MIQLDWRTFPTSLTPKFCDPASILSTGHSHPAILEGSAQVTALTAGFAQLSCCSSNMQHLPLFAISAPGMEEPSTLISSKYNNTNTLEVMEVAFPQ